MVPRPRSSRRGSRLDDRLHHRGWHGASRRLGPPRFVNRAPPAPVIKTGAGIGLVGARQGLKTPTGSRPIRPPVTERRYLPSTSLARISWYLAISSASRPRFSAPLIYFSQWSRIFLMYGFSPVSFGFLATPLL